MQELSLKTHLGVKWEQFEVHGTAQGQRHPVAKSKTAVKGSIPQLRWRRKHKKLPVCFNSRFLYVDVTLH
jgi:hypothetical protein